MCLAKPLKIIKIKNNQAVVQSSGHKHIVNIDLIKNVKIGDYVLVHNEMAINKLSTEEIEKILGIINPVRKS